MSISNNTGYTSIIPGITIHLLIVLLVGELSPTPFTAITVTVYSLPWGTLVKLYWIVSGDSNGEWYTMDTKSVIFSRVTL